MRLIPAFAIALLLHPWSALAQRMLDPSGKTCLTFDNEDECASVQPVWTGDPTAAEGPLSMERLANVTAPILWLSPREFLLLEYKAQHAPGEVDNPNGTRAVYYRVRTIRLKKPAVPVPPLAPAPLLSPGDLRIRVARTEWSENAGDLPIGQLDRVYITFFFYYPEDRGVGGHVHDLEALEAQIRIRTACKRSIDNIGGTIKALRNPADPCWPAAQLESASGSAHGVGWYTNTLQLTATRDTVLPLTALVEENKHATSPDRDGDGRYMPHYDVNRQSNDAWGIRDVAGSGKLGATSFRAELARDRRPENQVCPPAPSARLVKHYGAAVPTLPSTSMENGCLQSHVTYRLIEASTDPICARFAALKASSRQSDAHLHSLLADKHFCASTRDATVTGPRPLFSRRTAAKLARISPGPDAQYGFQNAVQRLSFAYRYDGGHGASAIVPLGGEVKFFGGWAVMKLNAVSQRLDRPLPLLSTTSIEALYSPSASRPFDWYVTVGGESHRYEPADERTWHVAEELGVKIRFSAERFRVIRFLGGRMGIRAESLKTVRNVRFVYEFGAGSW